MGSITIVGLGPGSAGHLSLETLQLLKERKVILRTGVHPTVAELDRQGIAYETCDRFYEEGATFEEVYGRIADRVMDAARDEEIVFAVPGSPLVAEKTVSLLRGKARDGRVPLCIRPAMSFLDLAYVALEIDPISGLRVIDAQDAEALTEAGAYPLMVTQVYDRMVASTMKLFAMEALPDETSVYFLRNLGLPGEECLEIPLFEIDRQPQIDHLTSVFIPRQPREVLLGGMTEMIEPGPVSAGTIGNTVAAEEIEEGEDELNAEGFWKRFPLLPAKTDYDVRPLSDVIQVLREPGGCPWDREQDFSSIRANLIEECYEFLEAVDAGDRAGMCEELGDILMQVVFHARMAEEKGLFDLQDVVDGVTRKLIERHPHVFGTVAVKDSGEVLRNWDAIKRREKPERKRILDGVYQGLPSLLRAYKIQHKAAKVGFDWTDAAAVERKFAEEWEEFKEALTVKDQAAMEWELGDLYFSLVNWARHLGLDSETALNRCNNRFTVRFSYVEERVKASGRRWQDFTLAELDAFWEEAKRQEVADGQPFDGREEENGGT